MEVKRVTCPKCGSMLKVKNSLGERVKNVTCPVCKNQLQVLFPNDDGETIYGGVPDDGRTVLPTKQRLSRHAHLLLTA